MRGKKVKWDVEMELRRVGRWRYIRVKGGVIMKEWKRRYMEV